MVNFDGKPEISVVVCTRNRGERIKDTIESILANTHPNFELVLVDQSTNDLTETAVKPYLTDARVTYIRSETVGAGRSRQIGLTNIKSDLAAYTDDDCTTPPNWLDDITKFFKANPEIAVVFFNVEPAPHDATTGYIPHRIYKEEKIIKNISESINYLGMAAGMSVRKQAALDIGGFDVNMGPGSKFMSAEDIDIGLRALTKHLPVCVTPSINVTHYGFRSFGDEFGQLLKRDWFAIGSVYAKLAKCRQKGSMKLIFYESFVRGLWHPLSKVFKLERPKGFKGFFYFYQGFFSGLSTKMDCKDLVYIISSDIQPKA